MQNLQLLVLLVLVPTLSALSVEERFNKLEAENVELKNLMRVENAELQKMMKELEKENVAHKKTIGSLEKTVEELLKRLESMERTVAEKHEVSSKVQERETKNDTSDLEVRVAALEEDVGELKGRVQNIESSDILQDQRIYTLEASVQGNEHQIEGLLESTTSLTGRVLGLDQRVQELESNGGGGDNSSVADYSDTIFLAALSTENTGDANPVLFDRDEINPGGHYDNSTGKYTVPSDGIYEFHVQMMDDTTSDTQYILLLVDGTQTHADNGERESYRSCTVILELQAGQEVWVGRDGGAYGDSYLRSYFWGRKISG